ncbi:MAG: sulfatase-like hydrolase/transferase, partial [Candidatus Binatia bacterium]
MRGRLLLIAFALALASKSGCTARHADTASGPIVLIVVDTLRADHLPCYGYERSTGPEICALAADGVLFERAYTPRTLTTPAIASMFTGLPPHRHGVKQLYTALPEQATTVAETLRSGGFRTGAFVSSFVMVANFSGLSQGFEAYDDRMTEREAVYENYQRSAAETVRRALEWLDTAGPRSFLFVHLIEPHGPYTPPSPFFERFVLPAGGPKVPKKKLPERQRLPGVDSVAEYVGRYDG